VLVGNGLIPRVPIFTPLLHKDVVESTACPHQKAVSTFLRRPRLRPSFRLGESSLRAGSQLGERGFPPGRSLPRREGLMARREQRGIISNGVNLSAEFNATTGFISF